MEKMHQHLLNIIKFDNNNHEEKQKMRLFLQHCNAVLRTMSTKEHINNLDEFHTYCLEANALMCKQNPWKLCAGFAKFNLLISRNLNFHPGYKKLLVDCSTH